MTVIVTGAAGFIGMHVCAGLLDRGTKVHAIDAMTPYYDPALKRARLAALEGRSGFSFAEADLSDAEAAAAAFVGDGAVEAVVHLAAQPGVRHSIEAPQAYVTANVMAQVNVLEAARRIEGLRQVVYASSSSVYGANSKLPFSESDRVDAPVSLYAATKRAAELVSESYARLHRLPQTGLRFFTVYGPWGRPDMSPWIFAEAIARGEPVTLYNDGEIARDFTYIDDVVAGVLAALDRVPDGAVPHRIYNLGNRRAERLPDLVHLIAAALGREAEIRHAPMQPGDMAETYADIAAAERDLGFAPRTDLAAGIPAFVEWFRDYTGL
jgi:UDP-glucuronate 4-epimerase